jgi:hypothetical protein
MVNSYFFVLFEDPELFDPLLLFPLLLFPLLLRGGVERVVDRELLLRGLYDRVDGLFMLLFLDLLVGEIDFDLRVEDFFVTDSLFGGVLFAGARLIILGLVVIFEDRGGFLTVRGV